MLLRHKGGAAPHPIHAAAPRVLQLLPDTLSSSATARTVTIAHALKSIGGEMIVAGGCKQAEHQFQRAGMDHRPYSGRRGTLFQMAATQALLDTVEQRNVALIHVLGHTEGLAARAFADAANLPLVMTCEDLPAAHGFLGRRGLRKQLTGRPIIARSDYAARSLAQDFGVPDEMVVTIPPGVDRDSFDPAKVSHLRSIATARAWGILDDPRPVVLVPGATAEPAWLNWVLGAAADPDQPEAIWLLVGDETETAAAEVAIRMSKARNRVRWVDSCPDWQAAYKLASLVACLPRNAGMLPASALEAQAMGRGVVISDIGAGSEMIQPGKTGWLVRHLNTGSLGYAIFAALARDEVVQEAMSGAARNFVRANFSLYQMQASTLSVFEEVLKARAHR